MEENVLCEAHRPQRVKQIISVPYFWEEKPGKPKKDWISKPTCLIYLPSPAKQIVSIPFQWEEKPGTPLAQFPQSPHFFDPPTPFYSPESSLTSKSIINSTTRNPFLDDDNDGDGLVSGLAIESFTFSMSPESKILPPTNTNPFLESSSDTSSNQQGSWFSFSEGERHSIISSSSVAHKSNIDTSAVEFHFPLFSPDTGFLRKVLGQDRSVNAAYEELSNNCYSTASMTTRRSMTLEELILLSRKLSYKMRHVEKKSSCEMVKNLEEFVRKTVLACFPFKMSGNKADTFIRSK